MSDISISSVPKVREQQYGALYALWQSYLHMAAWGQPEYKDLDEDDRKAFAALVEQGSVFAYVEDCKRKAVRAGVVPTDRDGWLLPLGGSALRKDKGLSQTRRDEIRAVLTTMYPWIVRFDAMESEGNSTAGQGQGVAPRNRWFLGQYEASGTDTYHKPTKICVKWNALTTTERAEICPDSPGRVTNEAVEQAIKRTKKGLARA
jgi:hypothetical protein